MISKRYKIHRTLQIIIELPEFEEFVKDLFLQYFTFEQAKNFFTEK